MLPSAALAQHTPVRITVPTVSSPPKRAGRVQICQGRHRGRQGRDRDAGHPSQRRAVYAPNTYFSEFSARALSFLVPRHRFRPQSGDYDLLDGVSQLNTIRRASICSTWNRSSSCGTAKRVFGRIPWVGLVSVSSGGRADAWACQPSCLWKFRDAEVRASRGAAQRRLAVGSHRRRDRDGFTRCRDGQRRRLSVPPPEGASAWAPASNWEHRIVTGERPVTATWLERPRCAAPESFPAP